jgi:hypothetical protein
MDLRRLRHGEWIAGISGVVLLVSLFLDWYSVTFKALPNDPSGASTAWEAFSIADVVLAIAALMGISLAVAAATQRAPAVAQALSALTVPVALAAAVFAVVHAVSLPDVASASRHGVVEGGWTAYAPLSSPVLHPPVSREIGLWLGLAGVLGVLVGAWRSMGDQSFPATARPEVEVTPLPAPKPRSEPVSDE